MILLASKPATMKAKSLARAVAMSHPGRSGEWNSVAVGHSLIGFTEKGPAVKLGSGEAIRVAHHIQRRGNAEKGKAGAQAKADLTGHWSIVCP